MGTGAFTSVEAERTGNIETAGDQNVFLQPEPAVDGDGDQYPNAAEFDDENIIDISYPSGPGDSSSANSGYDDIGVYLETGETLVAGVYIDTTDANLNDGLSESGNEDFDPGDLLLEDLVIYADATAGENGNYYVEVD